MTGTALHDELKRTAARWPVAASAKVEGFVRERLAAAAAVQGRRVVATARAELAQRAMQRFLEVLYDSDAGRLYNVSRNGQLRIPVPWSRRRHSDYGLTDRESRVLASIITWRLQQLPSKHQLLFYDGRRWVLNLARFPTHESAAAWLTQFSITPALWDEHTSRVPQRGRVAGRNGGRSEGQAQG